MAERTLTAGMLTEIAAGTVRPALLAEIVYVTGTPSVDAYLRLWTGVGDLSWNGATWTGGGQLLGISPIRETREVQAVGFAITISGMPADKIALALASMRKYKPGRLYLACFDSAGAVIADPYLLRRGRFDVIPIRRDGTTCTIEAKYEDRLVLLERANERRYTDEDQRRVYPTDTGFRHVAGLQDAQFIWGA